LLFSSEHAKRVVTAKTKAAKIWAFFFIIALFYRKCPVIIFLRNSYLYVNNLSRCKDKNRTIPMYFKEKTPVICNEIISGGSPVWNPGAPYSAGSL
jgi:hypothetical protein